MYNLSLRVALSGNKPCPEAFENGFSINNIEADDPFFGVPLSDTSPALIEDAHDALIDAQKKIVLYTVRMPHTDVGAYTRFFRNAHRLGIENVKVCLCTFKDDFSVSALTEIIKIADCFGINVMFEPRAKYPIFTDALYSEIKAENTNTGIIFNPSEYVLTGKNPFLYILYKYKFKDDIVFLRINDMKVGGEPCAPEYGNAEIKECVSALLARGYHGYFSFREYSPDYTVDKLLASYKKLVKEL